MGRISKIKRELIEQANKRLLKEQLIKEGIGGILSSAGRSLKALILSPLFQTVIIAVINEYLKEKTGDDTETVSKEKVGELTDKVLGDEETNDDMGGYTSDSTGDDEYVYGMAAESAIMPRDQGTPEGLTDKLRSAIDYLQDKGYTVPEIIKTVFYSIRSVFRKKKKLS